MSWKDEIKKNDGESYVEQIKQIAEDIEKVIKNLENQRRYIYRDIVDVDRAIEMLREINTET